MSGRTFWAIQRAGNTISQPEKSKIGIFVLASLGLHYGKAQTGQNSAEKAGDGPSWVSEGAFRPWRLEP